MDTLITIVHIAACFLLIIAVLVQGAKSSAMGLFSGTGSDAVMGGASGPSFIKRFTITMAVVVAVTSMSLTVMVTKQNSRSVVGKYAGVELPKAPAANAAQSDAPAAEAAK